MNTLSFNHPSHSTAFLRTLSEESLRQRVPSAFASTAHESRSASYTFISTAQVIDALGSVGFCPVEARQAVRAKSISHARHLIRFRRRFETVALRDAVPELLFLNSHDGTSAYQLRVGLYRAICTNGLVVAQGCFPVFRVAHRGDVVADVVRAALEISERFGQLVTAVERMEGTQLDQSAEWLEGKKNVLTQSSWERDRDQLLKIVGPYLASRPIAEIRPAELLAVLRRLEKRGALDTAYRVRAVCGRVFRYAIATGRAEHDISAALKGALTPKRSHSYPAVTDPNEVGQLLRAIEDYDGQITTHAALRLAPYLFVRPGELRGAEWREFDLAHQEWRIPPARMKMRELHIVPLATQVVDILGELVRWTGTHRFVFPAIGKRERPLSENTLNAALRRIGYSRDEMTGHGFRTIASTLLNELGANPDVIELQLAHKERNKERAAYNRAQRLSERRALMQTWADFLDGLRSGRSPVLADLERVHRSQAATTRPTQ